MSIAAPENQPRGTEINQNLRGLTRTQARFPRRVCRSVPGPVGIWTIGWGCTEGIREGMKITVEQAEKMLQDELEQFEAAVANLVKIPLNDDQFSALVAFSYNVGAGALSESTLLKLLNQGKATEAADEFPRWDKAGSNLEVLLGLSR